LSKHELEQRLKSIEGEFSPDKKFIVAYQVEDTDSYKVNDKTYTKKELDALGDEATIIFIVHYHSDLPGEGKD
jgi:hypothetical protein